jgi:hypothetical protein
VSWPVTAVPAPLLFNDHRLGLATPVGSAMLTMRQELGRPYILSSSIMKPLQVAVAVQSFPQLAAVKSGHLLSAHS